MRRVASCSSAARLRAVSVAATQPSAASVAGPAERRDALEPVLVDPGHGQRLGQPPGLGHAERLEPLQQRVLGVGGVERVERRAPVRPLDRLRVQGHELGGILALDAGFHEAAQRRADDVDGLHHLPGGAARRRGRVVQLVREPCGHRAERGQPFAALLDRGDAAHDGRDLLHHAPVHGGLREREPPELRRLDHREAAGRLGLHAHAQRPLGQRADRADPGRSELAAGRLDVISRDEERQHRALEQEEHAGRHLPVLGHDAESDKLLWVLGVDMAHMGRRYGDRVVATAERDEMLEVAERDRTRIARMEAGDAKGFWDLVQENHDDLSGAARRRSYTFMKAVPQARGELRHYQQWNIDEGAW